MENFMRHKLQGVRPVLKQHVVPHIFNCQKNVKPPGRSTRKVLMEVDKESKDAGNPTNMEVLSEPIKVKEEKVTNDEDNPTHMEVDKDTEVKEKMELSQKPDTSLDAVIKVEQDVPVDSKANISTEKTNESSGSSGNDEPHLKDIIRLNAGASADDNEEVIHLTAEETKQYLLKKIGEYMNTDVNPLFKLHTRSREIEKMGKSQVEEFFKVFKQLQLLQRKHENFLRSVDILPKIRMCHANVSADLPANVETLIKKDLSITRVEKPVNNPTQNNSAPVAKSTGIECIDLTDESESATSSNITKNPSNPTSSLPKHPAPLPARPFSTNVKKIPPKPRLIISAEDRGIVLQWDMPPNPKNNPIFDPISTFEIFGYQEQKNSVINTSLWKKIGSVKAMSLPMACTLTQFVDGNKYHFAIRAVNVNGLCGNYSDAISIVYKQKTKS